MRVGDLKIDGRKQSVVMWEARPVPVADFVYGKSESLWESSARLISMRCEQDLESIYYDKKMCINYTRIGVYLTRACHKYDLCFVYTYVNAQVFMGEEFLSIHLQQRFTDTMLYSCFEINGAVDDLILFNCCSSSNSSSDKTNMQALNTAFELEILIFYLNKKLK